MSGTGKTTPAMRETGTSSAEMSAVSRGAVERSTAWAEGPRTSAARWALRVASCICAALLLLAVFADNRWGAGLRWLLASGAVGAWLTLSTLGVFFPWLQMYAPALSRGPIGRGEVALTFDDGPHPVTTRRVLDLLRGTRHRATFFVLADKVRRHPEVIRAIHADGHTLALHGEVHDRLHSFRSARRIEAELRRARATLQEVIGVRARLFRPPLGHTSPLTVRGVARAGLRIVAWSRRGYDGLPSRTPNAVLASVLRGLSDGDIVLLHDAAERDDFEPASLAVLPELLAQLDQRGFRSVGLEDWLSWDAAFLSGDESVSSAEGERAAPSPRKIPGNKIG